MNKKEELALFVQQKQPINDLPHLWGGIECSITRTRAGYTDQLGLSGHYNRQSDIPCIARLGITALRFPILFERHQPEQGKPIDWSWAESRLAQIRENNITPIAGLEHHGSGPSYTNLMSSRFATGLAKFAGEVAAKFPWIEYYTPVNEPLTTARFSGLYGFWYPHLEDDRSFCRMLINQMTAVVLCMEEIRKINPAAKLIQTEDLGKSYANKGLQYQVNFENERRWLTFDLLCGLVDSDHSLWKYFIDNGIARADLEFFLDHPCPPEIMGLNYYATSERFLDDNLSAYPSFMHGGNGIEMYVDTEAVRVEHDQSAGLPILLKEVHNRYSLPMALTEVHLNCTREEQLRWFHETWNTCCSLKKEGLDIRAVTAWSLLGAFGWNKLLTSTECEYEPGVFDLRSPEPRPTALAKMIGTLASGKPFIHPALSQPGWWKRPERIFRQPAESTFEMDRRSPVLIIAGEGELGNAFAHACRLRCLPYVLRNRNALDLTNEQKVRDVFNMYTPWAVIDVSWPGKNAFKGEDEQLNYSSAVVAAHCKTNDIRLVNFSSHLVFGGNGSAAYLESDSADAQETYGKLIASLEQQALHHYPAGMIIRTGPLVSASDKKNIVSGIYDSFRKNKTVEVPEDVFITPSFVPDLVNTSMDLMIDEEKGIWHLASADAISLHHLALEICKNTGLDTDLIVPVKYHHNQSSVVLGSEKSWIMPSVHCSLRNYLMHHECGTTSHHLIFQESNR